MQKLIDSFWITVLDYQVNSFWILARESNLNCSISRFLIMIKIVFNIQAVLSVQLFCFDGRIIAN